MSVRSGIQNGNGRSEHLNNFLKGEEGRFPFSKESLSINTPLNYGSKPEIKFTTVNNYASGTSKKYLENIRELDVLFGELLDRQDDRLFEIDRYFDFIKNPLFDLGLPVDPDFSATDPATHARALETYRKNYDDQALPYVTNDGQLIPVNYLSGFLGGMSQQLPDFLGPGEDLRTLMRVRERKIGQRLNQSNEWALEIDLEENLNQPLKPMPDLKAAEEFHGEIVGVLNEFQPFISALNRVYQKFLYDFAQSKPTGVSRKVGVLLMDIRKWTFKKDSQNTVADKEAFKDLLNEFRNKIFPPNFLKLWNAYLQTFNTYDQLALEWKKTNSGHFHRRRQLSKNFGNLSPNLANAIKDAVKTDFELRAERLLKIQNAMNPLSLFNRVKLHSQEPETQKQFMVGLLQIALTVFELEFDEAKIVKWLRENPTHKFIPSKELTIISEERTAILKQLQELNDNLVKLPQAFHEIAQIENNVIDIYEGKIEIRRDFNMETMLRYFLVPTQEFLKKEFKDFLPKISSKGQPHEQMHYALKEKVWEPVFSQEQNEFWAPLTEVQKEELAQLKKLILAISPHAIRSVQYLLDQLIAVKKPSKAVEIHLRRKIFMHQHLLLTTEVMLKKFHEFPDQFLQLFETEYLKPRLTKWNYPIYKDPNTEKDHSYLSISEFEFQKFHKTLLDYDESDVTKEFRAKTQVIREKLAQETEKLAQELYEKGELNSFLQQEQFFTKRHAVERQEIREFEAKLRSEQGDTAIESPYYSRNNLLSNLREYLRPQVFFAEPMLDLMLIRRFSIKEEQKIKDLHFKLASYLLRNIRSAHRFDEKTIMDPQAIKHVWPLNTTTNIYHKNDLPNLDLMAQGAARQSADKKELAPVHTPESIRTVIQMAETLFPNLFFWKRGANIRFEEDVNRRFDRNPLKVLITPPGVRPMKEFPGIEDSRAFEYRRGKALGSISRARYQSNNFSHDRDYLYTQVTYDNRNRSLIVSADADETNFFHYLKAPEEFKSKETFSALLMGLGMVVFHQLPRFYQFGDYQFSGHSWRSNLLQSRARERHLYLDFVNEHPDKSYSAFFQTSGLSYSVSTEKMKNDYYTIELEFACYFSEIMMELMTQKIRNPHRPEVVDLWFKKYLDLYSWPEIQKLHKEEKVSQRYFARHEKAIQILDTYLGLRAQPELSFKMNESTDQDEDIYLMTGGKAFAVEQAVATKVVSQIEQQTEFYRSQFRNLEMALFTKQENIFSQVIDQLKEDPQLKEGLSLYQNKGLMKQAALLYFMLGGILKEDISRHIVLMLTPLMEQEKIYVTEIYSRYFSSDIQNAFKNHREKFKGWEDPLTGPDSKKVVENLFNQLSKYLSKLR